METANKEKAEAQKSKTLGFRKEEGKREGQTRWKQDGRRKEEGKKDQDKNRQVKAEKRANKMKVRRQTG